MMRNRVLGCAALVVATVFAGLLATPVHATWIEGPKFTITGQGPADATVAGTYQANEFGKQSPALGPDDWACTTTYKWPTDANSWTYEIEWEQTAASGNNICAKVEAACYVTSAALASFPSASITDSNQLSTAGTSTDNDIVISAATNSTAVYNVDGATNCTGTACDGAPCRVCVWRESTGCTTEMTEDAVLIGITINKNP